MKKYISLVVFLAFYSSLFSTIIPSDRLYTWIGNVGVPGGIPSRTTIFQTLGTAGQLPTFVQSVTDVQIIAAIDSCPANQVVYLNPGTYIISHSIRPTSLAKALFTLRGAGQGQTILKQNGIVQTIDLGPHTFPYPTASAGNVTAGAATGSNVFTMASTASINVDDLVTLMGTDPIWVIGHSAYGSNMNVTFRVTTKTSTTVTVDHALPITFASPYLVNNGPAIKGIGFEDFTVDVNNPGTYNGISGMQLANLSGCWLKNVEFKNSPYRQIFLITCTNNEIRHCYFHNTIYQTAGQGMNHEGVDFYIRSCWNWAEDNISDNGGFPSFVFGDSQSGSVGNAVTFNLILHVGTATDIAGGGISTHGGHSMFQLYEGNIGDGDLVSGDGLHGSASHTTVLRNWSMAKPYVTTGTNNSFNVVNGLRAIYLDKFCNYYNVVGNIFGDSTFPTTAPAGGYDTETANYASALRLINRLGYPNLGNNSYSGTYGPQSGLPDYTPASYGDTISNFNCCPFSAYQKLDKNVKNTIIRHVNYDFFNHAILYDGSIADHTVPDSLIYNAKPTWFGTCPWPPIDPGSANTVAMTNIPAGFRYVNGFDPPGSSAPSPTPAPLFFIQFFPYP